MTLLSNTFEGGTNTTVITTGNSGGASGDAFSGIVGSPTFTTTRAMHGTVSGNCPAGATADYVFYVVSSTDIAFRAYFYFAAVETAVADDPILRINNAAGHAFSVVRTGNSVNKLKVLSGASATVLGTSTATFPLNQWVRVEARATQSSTAGNIAVAFYLGDSATPVETAITSTTADTGSTVFTQVRAGHISSAATQVRQVDDFAVQTAAAGAFIGPSVTLSSATFVSIASSTGWTATGGTVLATVSDATDTTYITSSDNPTAVLFDGTLGPLSTPGADFTVQVRCQKLNAASGTMTLKLYDASTLRATVSGVAIPDTATTVNVTFLAANIGAVTSWSTGVRLTVEVTAS